MPSQAVSNVIHAATSYRWFTVSGVSAGLGGVLAEASLLSGDRIVAIGGLVSSIAVALTSLVAGVLKAYWDGREKSIQRDYKSLQDYLKRLQDEHERYIAQLVADHKERVTQLVADHEAEVKDLREQVRELIREIKGHDDRAKEVVVKDVTPH